MLVLLEKGWGRLKTQGLRFLGNTPLYAGTDHITEGVDYWISDSIIDARADFVAFNQSALRERGQMFGNIGLSRTRDAPRPARPGAERPASLVTITTTRDPSP